MTDLVPVRRGEQSPAPWGRPWTAQRFDPFWEPFREFDDLWNRMVSRFFEGPAGGWQQGWTPLVDLEETDDAWVFEVDLPGVRREDMRIEVTDRFSYRTTLPAGVDTDRVEARFDNGVLTVHVPRPEQAKPRQIKID
jgi:HSP20 family protein